jgi:hypothetical protein
MLYDVYCYAPPLFLAVSKATAVRSAYNRLIGFVRGKFEPWGRQKVRATVRIQRAHDLGLKKVFFSNTS